MVALDQTTSAELFVLALAPHARLDQAPDGTGQIATRELVLPLGALSPALAEAMQTLASSGASEQALARRVLTCEGLGPLTLLQSLLAHCRQLGLLSYRLDGRDGPLATCVPLAPSFRLSQGTPASAHIVLSRFCYCRREAGGLVVESPAGLAKVLLHDPQIAFLLAALARPCDRAAVRGALPALDEDRAAALLLMLHSSGAILPCDAEGRTAEDSAEALRQWEFHDLLFYSRSRNGRHHNPAGRTFPFRDTIRPLPGLKPLPAGRPLIALPQPDLDALARSDPPLTTALERRRSLRGASERPPTLAELGAFLYRSARVRSLAAAPLDEDEQRAGEMMEISSRPYPSGGAIYELELYLSIHRCEGLEAGLYHYEPQAHALTLVRQHDLLVERLLRQAASATGLDHTPDILITLAARFQRMAWKYQSIAYATVLKDVGALYQTMYLVATAMGLSPCALGNGDAELFAAAAGTDYYAEGSVGEFLLGGPVPVLP